MYKQLLQENKLQLDDKQTSTISILDSLHYKLSGYKNSIRAQSIFNKFFKINERKNQKHLGLYVYGNVGTGKTMMMDLFYHCVNISQKKRVHYNSFMLDVHSRIHRLKRTMNKSDTRRFDPIQPVAIEISHETSLLCLDEFQVTDIADAMILKHLFAGLFDAGVVLIATSNRPPDDLYKGGLQRSNFLPFIQSLKENCNVLNLDSPKDYRMEGTELDKSFFLTSKMGTKQHMEKLFVEHASNLARVSPNQVKEETLVLRVLNRDLVVKRRFGKVSLFTFNELCAKPVGAIDYLEICKHFAIVVFTDVPKMNIFKKTEARRFITLVDTLYDNKVYLIMSADTKIKDLFVKPSNEDKQKILQNESILLDDLQIKQDDSSVNLNVFSGEEEEFAFARAQSRLNEMQTKEYWHQHKSMRPEIYLK